MAELGDRIQAFQAKLDGITEERSARNELTGRRVTESVTRHSEENEKFMRTVGSVALRLNERYQQIKESGGWDTANGRREPHEERSFGFEEEDIDADMPMPVEPLPGKGSSDPSFDSRPRKRQVSDEEFDDDDFSNNSWLG